MFRLDHDVGFEVLAKENPVKVSRFSRRIRLLHWFNAIMIISLYTLAFIQVFETIGDGQISLNDTRPLHAQTGQVWILGLLCLALIASMKSKRSQAIMTEKLIIKQKIFLYGSISVICLMAMTGLTLYYTRNYNIPEVRSILLSLHGLIAMSYLPLLGFHIYLALFHKDSKNSLRTMFTDVYVKYLIHNEIPDLKCWISDDEAILFIHGDVLQISILGFQVNIPEGGWQKRINFKEATQVDFIHPELAYPLRMKLQPHEWYKQNGFIHASFRFSTDIQQNAKQLMSHAIFFRHLFLQQRTYPRLSCNFPVMIYSPKGECLGEMVDLSLAGAGVLLPIKLDKGCVLRLVLELKHPVNYLDIRGEILIIDRVSRYDWSYGICFDKISAEQHAQITKILSCLRTDKL